MKLKITHQLKVWQECKIVKGELHPSDEVVLAPRLSIEEIQYWQKRIWELLPGVYASAMVAK